jgi:ribosomal protein S18 acetylase RimI-like enzyme
VAARPAAANEAPGSKEASNIMLGDGEQRSVKVIEVGTDAQVRLAAPLFDQYRVFYGQKADLQASYEFLRERWIARESVLFLAIADSGEASGFVQLFPFFLTGPMRRFWVLNDLYVKPSGRRKGTARALMRRAERYASETGSAGLTLSTAIDNVNAQALYESEGYVRDSLFFYYNRFLP